MIDRYTRPEMGHIFSLENKYAIWQEIEVLACEAQAELGKIGISKDEAQWIRDHANFEKAKVDEIEEVTRHDVIAFLTNMKEYIDADVPEGDPKPSRWVHYGMTSSDLGDTALCYQLTQACDLIISDALMPEMDGFDLLMKVRNDEMLCHIPFILLSVVDSVDSKIKGLEYGADVYIEKPFSLGYVKATVESLLENRKRAFRHFASRPGFQYEKDDMGRNDRQWLDKLTGIVRENLTCETLSVDLLTEKMALSRSSLQRKLKGLTGVSPNEYIQLVRLKTAAQLLRSGEYRISEVCYQTGFSSMSWFAKCFTKQFGMRPKDFIQQPQNETQCHIYNESE